MTGLKNHRKSQLKAYGIIKFCSSNICSFLILTTLMNSLLFWRLGIAGRAVGTLMQLEDVCEEWWFQEGLSPHSILILGVGYCVFGYSLLCCNILWLLGFAYVLESAAAQISLWVRKLFPVVRTASVVAIFAEQLCSGEQAGCKALQPPLHSIYLVLSVVWVYLTLFRESWCWCT